MLPKLRKLGFFKKQSGKLSSEAPLFSKIQNRMIPEYAPRNSENLEFSKNKAGN
jgi:hypothetical protein